MDQARAIQQYQLAQKLAIEFGWRQVDHQPQIYMASFVRDGVRLNYYYSKRTVGTAMLHPTKGKTQLFRQDVGIYMLRKIFNYPRVHTHRGYYRKESV